MFRVLVEITKKGGYKFCEIAKTVIVKSSGWIYYSFCKRKKKQNFLRDNHQYYITKSSQAICSIHHFVVWVHFPGSYPIIAAIMKFFKNVWPRIIKRNQEFSRPVRFHL